MEPLVIASLIALMGTVTGSIIAVWRSNSSNGRMCSKLEAVVGTLNSLHDDIREALRESREEHGKMIEALIKIVERQKK